MKVTRSIVFLFAVLFASILVQCFATPDPSSAESGDVEVTEAPKRLHMGTGAAAAFMEKCEAGYTKASEFVRLTGTQKEQKKKHLRSRTTRATLILEAKVMAICIVVTIIVVSLTYGLKPLLVHLTAVLIFNFVAAVVSEPLPHTILRLVLRSIILVLLYSANKKTFMVLEPTRTEEESTDSTDTTEPTATDPDKTESIREEITSVY